MKRRKRLYRGGGQIQQIPLTAPNNLISPQVLGKLPAPSTPAGTPLSAQPKGGGLGDMLGGMIGGINPMMLGAQAIAAIGANVTNAIGEGLAGKNTSKAGELFKKAGSMFKGVPVVGGLLEATTNLPGHLINAAIGSNIDEAKVREIEDKQNQQRSIIGSSDLDTLSQQFSDFEALGKINTGDIGSDGWWSNKAKNKAAELTLNNMVANINALSNMQEGNINAQKNNMYNTMSNIIAEGGPLNSNGGTWDNGLVYINNGGTHEGNPYEGVQMGVAQDGIPNLVEEGEIVWNDYVFSNRLKVPKSLRTKYKLGRKNNISFADAIDKLSKESKENPFDPIIQNTLDSMLPEFADAQEKIRMRNQGRKLQEAIANMSPEELAMLQQQAIPQQQMMPQEDIPLMAAYGGKLGRRFDGNGNQSNVLSQYGYVSNYPGNWFDSDGNYKQEYLDFINNLTLDQAQKHFNDQYAFYTDQANKGTTRWKAIDEFYADNPWANNKDYKVPQKQLDRFKALAQDKKTGFMHMFLPDAPQMNYANRHWIRPNDGSAPIRLDVEIPYWEGVAGEGDYHGKTWLDVVQNKYKGAAFKTKQRRDPVNGTIYTDYYYDMPVEKKDNFTPEELAKIGFEPRSTWQRYAPIIAGAAGVFTDALGLTNKPSYANAEALKEFARDGFKYQEVSPEYIGNYLTYKPVDPFQAITTADASTRATARDYMNVSGANPLTARTGLIATDYANQLGRAQNAYTAQELNWNRLKDSETFNKETNVFNANAKMTADQANQQALASNRNYRYSALSDAMKMREAERIRAEQAKGLNLSNLITNIGNIGKENAVLNQRDFAILSGQYGNFSDSALDFLDVRRKACGGKINRRKKKTTLMY